MRLNATARAHFLLALALSAGALGGCDAAPQAAIETPRPVAVATPQAVAPAPVPPAANTARTADFAARIGAECPSNAPDAICDGGDYDIELRDDCGADGFFGGVAAEGGSILLDTIPPRDKTVVGRLSKGQIVCIRAIARAGQGPNWYYVSTLPVATIAACQGNALCDTYGDRPIAWTDAKAPRAACTVDTLDRPDSGCASGWIDAKALEAFSEGM